MKKLLVIAIVIGLSSCERCYECTITQESFNNQGGPAGQSVAQTNFCGTPKEKTKHEKEGSHTMPLAGGGSLVTKTACTEE